ncbi:MAG: hypothetical protein ABWZ56_05515 [Flavobacterium sp.]
MKKLEDFECEKVEIKSVYGGKVMAALTEFDHSCTVGGANNGMDDGCDSFDDN